MPENGRIENSMKMNEYLLWSRRIKCKLNILNYGDKNCSGKGYVLMKMSCISNLFSQKVTVPCYSKCRGFSTAYVC